jgi:hypothetical protein
MKKILCSLCVGFVSLSAIAQNSIVIPDDPFKGMDYVSPVAREAVRKDQASRFVFLNLSPMKATHSISFTARYGQTAASQAQAFLYAKGESITVVNESIAIYGVQPNLTPMVTISYIDKPVRRVYVTPTPHYYYRNGQWYLYR